MAGQAVLGEGCGVGWVPEALPCPHQAGEGLPQGDILEFPMKRLLGDLISDREERCQPLTAVGRGVSPSVMLCCPAAGQVRTAG